MTSTTVTEAGERPAGSLAERLAPSIPAVFFVLLSILMPLAVQRRMLNNDGDLARHLSHGLWMFQHHSLIWRDPFSFSRPGQPFVPFEYGSQLVYTGVYRAFGLAGVTILAAVLVASVYALFARFLLRRGVDPLLALFATTAAVFAGGFHWIARPHLISWVAIILFFGWVEPHGHRPRLWAYGLFFAVWANFHGGWLYGIALIGIYLTGNLAEYLLFGRHRDDLSAAKHFAAALPIAGFATLATPMGIKLWQHLYAHLSDSYVFDHTGEFVSPDFHTVQGKIMGVLLLGPVAALLLSHRRMHMSRLLIFLAGIWWTLVSQRNIPLFGLTGLGVLALHLDPEWRELNWGWFRRRRAGFAAGGQYASTTGWIVGCSALLLILAASHGSLGGTQLLKDEFDSHIFPIAAVEHAKTAALPDRMLADFRWGGYVLFAWPGKKVFIDGGTDFYRSPVMRTFNEITSLAPGWRTLLDREGIEAVMTDPHKRFARELARTSGWTVWYCDRVATIIRRDPSLGAPVSPSAREQALVDCAGPPIDLDKE